MAAEAVILGSGTSNGVPMLGVKYPEAFLANPRNHRNRACLAVRAGDQTLIVDCPPEMRLMCSEAKIYTIDSVLITHSHADHVMGMDDLRSICILTGRPLPVYTLPRYQEDIRRIFNYAFREFPPGVMVPRFDLRDVPDELRLGDLYIRTFTVQHGSIPVTGIRVNDFAYITDVSHIPDEARACLNGLKTFVVDAVRYKPHPNHFHYERAIEVAREVGAEQTYFTHLSGDYDHDLTNRDLPTGMELAYDGLVVPL